MWTRIKSRLSSASFKFLAHNIINRVQEFYYLSFVCQDLKRKFMITNALFHNTREKNTITYHTIFFEGCFLPTTRNFIFRHFFTTGEYQILIFNFLKLAIYIIASWNRVISYTKGGALMLLVLMWCYEEMPPLFL